MFQTKVLEKAERTFYFQ